MNEMYGLDEEKEVEETVTSIQEHKKKRTPFAYWEVNGTSHKLKLTTAMICKLESKYKTNLLNLVDDMPPLSVMLTIIQAGLTPWEHGAKFETVQKMYDNYVEEGGSQLKLFTDIIMQLLAVSGFFTENQAENLMKSLKEAEELM